MRADRKEIAHRLQAGADVRGIGCGRTGPWDWLEGRMSAKTREEPDAVRREELRAAFNRLRYYDSCSPVEMERMRSEWEELNDRQDT